MSEQRTDTQEGAQPATGAAIGAAVRSGQPAHPTAAALAEWRRLAGEATPGRWSAGPVTMASSGRRVFVVDAPINDEQDGQVAELDPEDVMNAEQDAAFIAAARTAVPALLTAYEAERARAERLEAALRQARSAVASLNEDALGRHHTIGYPFRDELLAHITAALAPEGAGR